MAENESGFQGTVEALLKGMNGVLSTKTVVGEATKIGDTIILPLVDVTFGVGAGSGNKASKENGSSNSGTGVGGIGGKLTPSAVLVIQNGNVKLVNIKNQDTVTKVLDMVPDMVDKFLDKKKEKESGKNGEEVTDENAVKIAFPEGN